MTMEQETLEPVETNDIGQVKIVSSAKIGKWVWVNAKQYRGILKRRLAHLKWEKTRKKRSQRESTWVLRKKQHSNKSSLQICGNKSKGKGKVIDDYALYIPTSTPLTWSSDFYVKELLKVKERLEVVEAKELESVVSPRPSPVVNHVLKRIVIMIYRLVSRVLISLRLMCYVAREPKC
jgi:hypothetical protein